MSARRSLLPAILAGLLIGAAAGAPLVLAGPSFKAGGGGGDTGDVTFSASEIHGVDTLGLFPNPLSTHSLTLSTSGAGASGNLLVVSPDSDGAGSGVYGAMWGGYLYVPGAASIRGLSGQSLNLHDYNAAGGITINDGGDVIIYGAAGGTSTFYAENGGVVGIELSEAAGVVVNGDIALEAVTANSLDLSTVLPIADGGTGQGTATAAFDALSPTTTQGDILYHNGTDNVRLAKGTASQVLTMNAGATAPEWAAAGGGSGWTQEVDFVTADVTTSGTTPIDVTGVSFTLDANDHYGIECIGRVRTSATATAPQVGLDISASADTFQFACSGDHGASAGFMAVSGSLADDGTCAFTGASQTSSNYGDPLMLLGFIDNGASSNTLKLRLRSEVANADVVGVNAGMRCTVTKLVDN